MVTEARPRIRFGAHPLRIEHISTLARHQAGAELESDPAYRAQLDASVRVLAAAVERGDAVYGVTTGVGDSCDVRVPPELVEQLPVNLFRFHGCGTGRTLTELEGAAVLAVRLASLARGYSGVRSKVLEGLCDLLDRRVTPCIPAEGSVGASGDLTPLSYVAACLTGERSAYFEGRSMPAADALRAAGLAPLRLGPKESLAIMNGTSVMTGLACLAFEASRRLGRMASALTAMACDVLQGVPGHFDDRIFELKPHPGQRTCAAWIREDLAYDPAAEVEPRLRIQDRYSLRCAPHVIGVLLDVLPLSRQIIETEINSVNDNPILDPETGRVFSGGNFYGGHVCFVMDGLKNAVANVADLLDRQLSLLCNPVTNNGLPANLVGAEGPASRVSFGFKAMQITTSALAAEALKLTMPASVFSRSTENHNQDKVSMGTIAARECLRVLELTETVAVIHLLGLCQAADLRRLEGCHARTHALHAAVRALAPMVNQDRAMDGEIATLLARYRDDALPIGAVDWS